MRWQRMARLAALLGAIAETDRLRLAGLAAGSAALRGKAAELRRRSREAVPGHFGPASSGELAALAAWGRSLAGQARDAETRALALDAEAEPLRRRFAHSFARARAVARLAGRMDDIARREAARRLEMMQVPPAGARAPGPCTPLAGDQASSGSAAGSDPGAPDSKSAASPAIT